MLAGAGGIGHQRIAVDDDRVGIFEELDVARRQRAEAEDGRGLGASSSVREAHLTRIERFVRDRLADPDLDPERIAAGCRISTRYLHELFRDTGRTVGGFLRDLRLEACREALADPAARRTLAETAYRAGFSDQAQFSRLFKARYGATPKEYRMKARAG